jgi:hypothetical protein
VTSYFVTAPTIRPPPITEPSSSTARRVNDSSAVAHRGEVSGHLFATLTKRNQGFVVDDTTAGLWRLGTARYRVHGLDIIQVVSVRKLTCLNREQR